ncbi:phage tail spike protein [Streptococcus mitis]|uniref:phage tail spike protein n=1 Tax=Streptococcus mitis TaxID=28037 RepID=UPI0021B7152F|nr:phage tail spike protein [Streptococcus mitis]
MIYLTNGNMPLNAAYADEIVQEDNSTYQLSFRFPTSDSLWEQLKEEAFLTADDLHGEQDFVIFEVEKKHGYIQVYAKQVFTLLNNYVVSSLTLDQATGSTALSHFAGAITRDNPFSFFSDIEDRHTFNIGSKNAMEAFAKDKHSIIGQWGGDLVRHGYQVRLLKNGGSENESLFMYKKNLSSYQHKTSTKSLKTRITFIATVKGEGEKAPDRKLSVVVDSPLINKYSQIYEDVIEVNDRDVKDEASLRKYGEQYYRTSLCDMMEDSLELEVVGQSDVPVQMFDIVSLFHDVYNLDVRKKITKYTYSPMGKKLKTIGFGQFKSGLANAIGNAVSDAVKGEAQQLQSDFERQLARELKNADLAFDRQKEELVNQFTDGLNAAKARAEEVKRELSDTINQHFDSFDNASIQEAKRRAEEALRNAGASSLLAQEAKRISERARADITNLQESSQNALSQIESFKNQYGTKLNEVKSTADGLFTKMGVVETYISKDGQRQESLQRYARDESARQVSAIREQISRDYVGKSTYQEDVRGLERRFNAISTQTDNDIATKIAQYKQTVDGQFASITSQIAGKVNQTDFQRVRETSQLYERIIGSNENDISNKVARMALTSQLFQVEVAKSLGSDNNLIVRSKSMDRHTLVNEGNTKRVFVNDGIFTIRCTGNSGYTFAGFTLPLYIDRMARGETYTLNFKYRIMGRLDHNFTVVAKNHRANDASFSSNIATSSTAVSNNWQEFNETYTISRDFEFGNSDIYPLYFYLAKNGWVEIKEIMLVRASQTNGYKASQFDDMSEAVRTVQSQLAGSWAVQNINSAGDIISGINLGADGRNRFIGKTFHITGETLIDNAVIKSAMVDKLKTANFEAGSVTTTILDAEAVTADKLRVDQALFNKLVANEAYLSMLFAKQAFINRVRSISIDASQIKTGTLSGDRIYGGTISGTTLTGHTRINLGEYGSFDTVNGGLQINVPRAVNSKDGLGVQFIGSSGRGENVPYGLFVYKDDDITRGDTARDTDEFIMTVQGYINTKGIGWLKTGKGKVGSVTTGTLGFWQSTVALDYAPNDIYYTYNGTAYGLWAIIKQSFSDSRLKENIVDCKHKALDYIQQFQFKEYDWKKQEDRPQQAHTKIGLIAQEVQAVDPTLVYENGDTLNLDNLRLTTMALKAIQELNQRLEKLEEIA